MLLSARYLYFKSVYIIIIVAARTVMSLTINNY